MPEPIVMIAFYSKRGRTEKLATAAAVGAVQGRARIRLRRMPDADRGVPDGCEATMKRMIKEYVAPAEADVSSADALVFGVPGDFTPGTPEWKTYLELLARLQAAGKLRGKVGVVLGSEPGLSAFAERMAGLDLSGLGPGASLTEEIAIGDVDRATRLGRRVAEAARSLNEPTAQSEGA